MRGMLAAPQQTFDNKKVPQKLRDFCIESGPDA